jgi:hypothetical protein
MIPSYRSSFLETDPEFIASFDNFAFDEVVNASRGEGDRLPVSGAPASSAIRALRAAKYGEIHRIGHRFGIA